MKIRSFNKDELVFRQGDASDVMYDILSGSVGVYVAYGTENETLLTVLKAGDFLGEMGVIEVYPRSATAVAAEDGTQLKEISAAEFSDFFRDQPERLLKIMRQLSQRLRDRTEDYEAACVVLKNLEETSSEPDMRSKSLLQKVKDYISLYNNVMSTAYKSDYGTIIQDSYFYYWTRR